jgi:uncharacterized protein
MHYSCDFTQAQLPREFSWLNPPAAFQLGKGLEITTAAKTDFWQKTHYGFQPDSGHCLLVDAAEDFCMSTQVEFTPVSQYDQCGLMVRLDKENWIKMGTEFENEQISRLGSVVTNLGYSDWATQDVPSGRKRMSYRIHKNGADFLLENSQDGKVWNQMRIAHLHQPFSSLRIGIYACSPIGENFHCRFTRLDITENAWGYQA